MKKIIAAAVSAVISLSSVASSMPLIKETSMTVSAEEGSKYNYGEALQLSLIHIFSE